MVYLHAYYYMRLGSYRGFKVYNKCVCALAFKQVHTFLIIKNNAFISIIGYMTIGMSNIFTEVSFDLQSCPISLIFEKDVKEYTQGFNSIC